MTLATIAARTTTLGLALVWSAAAAGAAPVAEQRPNPPPPLRVFSAGHSFHVFMPGILTEIAKSAGIEKHQQAGVQSIGGSYVHQHWDRPDEQNTAKRSLTHDHVDVLTLSPIYLPDDGIENFVKLAAESSPKTRVTVQEFWLPYDVYDLNYKKQRPAPVDRDARTVAQLHAEHDPYFKSMDDHVRMLNEKYGKRVYVVPTGQAAVALRELIIAGKAPGLTKQNDLFTDAIGHATAPLKVLNAYCHYAVLYRRSPVGLPMPAALKDPKHPEWDEKLNRVLQELAWKAAEEHPLSGVKETP